MYYRGSTLSRLYPKYLGKKQGVVGLKRKENAKVSMERDSGAKGGLNEQNRLNPRYLALAKGQVLLGVRERKRDDSQYTYCDICIDSMFKGQTKMNKLKALLQPLRLRVAVAQKSRQTPFNTDTAKLVSTKRRRRRNIKV